MSRNEGRIGAPNLPTEVAVQSFPAPQEVNMSWYTPTTMFVELPSQGLFYPKEHPLHQALSVEIKYMTTKEEEFLTNKGLIKEGLALDRVVASVLVDKRIVVESLLLGDKSAILVGARISGFEEMYNFKTSCGACGNINEVSYNLDERKATPVVEEYLQAKRISDGTGNFTVTLPRSGVELECRLMTGYDELNNHKTSQIKKKNKLDETPMSDLLKTIIVSVNGDTSKGNIKNFVENGLTVLDSRHLRNVYKEMNPTIDMTSVYQCKQCDYFNHIDIPITTDFFWPRT